MNTFTVFVQLIF